MDGEFKHTLSGLSDGARSIDCAQPKEQCFGGFESCIGRRLEPLESFRFGYSGGAKFENRFGQVGASNLRSLEFGSGFEILNGVESQASPRTRASCASCTLSGGGAADSLGLQHR